MSVLHPRKPNGTYSQNIAAYTPEELRAYHRNWYHRRVADSTKPKLLVYRAESRRRWQYGVEPAEYNRMLQEQVECCKLCHAPFQSRASNLKESPVIEHSHRCSNSHNHKQTGLMGGCAECVRGLVCQTCNHVVVRFLELYPDRQTDAERVYMADRPLLRYRAEAGQR
jgi:hypothetical protein